MPVSSVAVGDDDGRVVLRSQVQPPFDIGQYPSPLASFRRYVKVPEPDAQNLYDKTLLTLECAPAGSRLRIAAQDRPGALAAITATFHKCGVNIIEVQHKRIFTRLPAKDTSIEVECEARDAVAIEHLVEALEAAGFEVERASLD